MGARTSLLEWGGWGRWPLGGNARAMTATGVRGPGVSDPMEGLQIPAGSGAATQELGSRGGGGKRW